MIRIKDNVIFSLTIVFFSISFLYFSQSYPERSRMMPYYVSLIVLFLAIIDLLIETMPSFKRFNFVKINYFNKKNMIKELEESTICGKELNNKRNNYTFYNMLLWILITVIGIYYFGFLITLPAFVGLFYRSEVGYRWVKVFIIAFTFWAMVLTFFQILLNVELYKGVFFL